MAITTQFTLFTRVRIVLFMTGITFTLCLILIEVTGMAALTTNFLMLANQLEIRFIVIKFMLRP